MWKIVALLAGTFVVSLLLDAVPVRREGSKRRAAKKPCACDDCLREAAVASALAEAAANGAYPSFVRSTAVNLGVVVQREDAALAVLKRGFDSPRLHSNSSGVDDQYADQPYDSPDDF